MRISRKSIAISLIMTVMLSNMIIPYASAEPLQSVVVENGFIQATTNSQNGRFSIRTIEGSPYRDRDQESNLLFMDKEPETSFTTFRIDGKDYIYGNDYSFTEPDSSFINPPNQDRMLSQSTWKIGEIEISQQIELRENIENLQVGNARISYIVVNKGSRASQIGTRILLDTMLGKNDGAPLLLPDSSTPLRSEKEFLGEDVPAYWRAMDSSSNPEVVGYGLIEIPSRQKPDKAIVGHWNALSKTKWDYTIVSDRTFSSIYNDFGSADSAVALYWSPMEIKAGETKIFETYYGLGELMSDQEGDFNINISAPSKLSVGDGGYLEEQFKITAEIDNTLSKSEVLRQLKLALDLPEGLKLAPGEMQEKTIEYLPKENSEKVEWLVVPETAQKLRVLETRVRAYSEIVQERSKSRFIILPGVGGELPEVYYQDYMPKLLYGQDEDKSIHIIGKGFSLFTDLTRWDFYLENQDTEDRYYILNDFITIVNDTHISARIDSPLDVGRYSLKIEHETYGEYAFGTQLEVSNDSSLVSRDYDLLAISKGDGGNYVAKMLNNEEANQENRALIIRGKVREITKGEVYEVIPKDTVTINSLIKYKGNALQVYKEGSLFKIKGEGTLRLNTKMAGNPLDVKLFEGKFVLDSAALTFKPESGYIHSQKVEKVGALPLIIKNTRLDGEDGVYIDADLQLPIKQMNKLFTGSYFTPGALLENIHLNSNGVVYTGDIEIPFPSWKIGSFESKYNKITLSINTKNDNYGIKTVMKNRPLKLNDINTTLMFKNWVPDYFEFSNDFGSIPKPIGTTGMGFKKIGGGIYGIYKLWEDKNPTTTIKATTDIVDLISPTIKGYKLINGKNLTTTLGLSGIDITGDGYIYFVDVGDIKGEFFYDSGGYIEADLNLVDILIMEAYISITKDSAEAFLNGEVRFPKYVPFVGGEKLAGFSAGMSTQKIWGSTEFLKCDVGVTYTWNNQKFDFDASLFSMAGSPIYAGRDKGLYTINRITEDGKNETVVFGSNIEKVENNALYTYAGGSLFSLMATWKKQHTITINELETALIKVDYSGATPSIEMRKPDGSLYELRPNIEGETDPNYRNQVISAEDSESGVEEKSIYIVITSPDNGNWFLQSDKEVNATLYNVKKAPKFNGFSAVKNGGASIEANWDLTTYENSFVSLYLVKDGETDMSIPIIENIEADLTHSIVGLPSGIRTGKYAVLAKVIREDFGYDVAFSETFEITDSMAPETPTGFSINAIGNGKFKATWDEPEGFADGYYIEVVDENGERDTSAGEGILTEGSSVIFGGVVEDASGESYGWLTNREYRFSLSSVDYEEIEGEDLPIYHYSKPVISSKVFLPNPEPPTIDVVLTLPDGNINDVGSSDDIETKMVSGSILEAKITLDKEASVEIYNNSILLKTFDGTQSNIKIHLVEGINEMLVKATSLNGDVAIKEYNVISDTSAPYLMVESPLRVQLIEGDSLIVSGRTEAGALLTINGQETIVESDGSFGLEVALSSDIKKEINIKSQDGAGNLSSYLGEVWRGNTGEITGITIKPTEVEIENGAQKQLQLYFKTSDGTELRIDSSTAEWEVIGNPDTADVSNGGLLYGRAVGEIIVKAAYKISEGYFLEDAILVNIIPRGDMPPQESEEPQEPQEPEKPDENPSDDDQDTNNNNNTYNRIEKGQRVKINAEGSTIVEMPNKIRIEIPQGTLPAGSYITVREVLDRPENPDYMVIASPLFEIEIIGNDQTFQKEAKITLYYDGKIGDTNRLGIYLYNDTLNTWELVGGKTEQGTQGITVSLEHFSLYGVFENNKLTVMGDLPNHWAKDAVNRLILKEIVNGIPVGEGTFRYNPEGFVTRAEFAKLLATAKGFKIDEDKIDLDNVFVDWEEVPSWARPYMSYCYSNGLIEGSQMQDGRYIMPKGNITRAEVATMLGRTLNPYQFENVDFVDGEKVPQWAQNHVKVLSNLGIMKGYPDNSFKANNRMTRAEAAALINNYLKFDK